jgi:cyanophycinase
LEDVERLLMQGRPLRYVQLATAAAPEGPQVLARWHDLGARAAGRIGAEQVVVPVGDRAGAMDDANARLIEGAGLIYLSGGNPAFLTETLRDTVVWKAIHRAWLGGAALAGCSAGAMALAASLPDIRHPWRPALPGLGVVPMAEVLPHFDAFAARIPDLVLRRVAGAPAGVRVVGIDEETALVGGLGGWPGEPGGRGTAWQVLGRRSAWLLTPQGRHEVKAGSAVVLD